MDSNGKTTQSIMLTSLELNFLKQEIGKRFPFYEYRQTPNGIAFFCKIDKSVFNTRFSDLRERLSKDGFIPLFRHDHGEDVIYIIKKPDQKSAKGSTCSEMPPSKVVPLELVFPNGTILRVQHDLDLAHLRVLIHLYD